MECVLFSSGVLKQEIIDNDDNSLKPSHIDIWTSDNATVNTPRFTSIKSKVSYASIYRYYLPTSTPTSNCMPV